MCTHTCLGYIRIIYTRHLFALDHSFLCPSSPKAVQIIPPVLFVNAPRSRVTTNREGSKLLIREAFGTTTCEASMNSIACLSSINVTTHVGASRSLLDAFFFCCTFYYDPLDLLRLIVHCCQEETNARSSPFPVPLKCSVNQSRQEDVICLVLLDCRTPSFSVEIKQAYVRYRSVSPTPPPPTTPPPPPPVPNPRTRPYVPSCVGRRRCGCPLPVPRASNGGVFKRKRKCSGEQPCSECVHMEVGGRR